MKTQIKKQSTQTILSIIIISYNTQKITEDCIESVYKSFSTAKKNIPFEIVLIDNNSQDGSVEMIQKLQKQHDNIQFIKNTKNTGFAKANNQGVEKARGEYILLLNSDIIVLEDAIPQLLTYFRENEDHIQFLGGKLLNKDMTAQASCGPAYTLPVMFAAQFLKGDYYGLTRQSPDKVKEIDWVMGACILTKKTHYQNINGFDEDIFMYMDEVDLLYRAKKKGYRVFFYPHARFIHLTFASSGGGKSYPVLQVYKGFLYYYKKHHTPLEFALLKSMLQLKALISLTVGKLTGSQYLITTYGKAYKLAQMGG